MNKLTISAGSIAASLIFPLAAFAAQIAIQPGPATPGMDTWLSSNYNQNAQLDGKLLVGGWGDEYDTMLRFDLSGLPLNATQAQLYFYAYPLNNKSSLIGTTWYLNYLPWRTSSLTWATLPTASLSIGTLSAPPVSGWYAVDITSIYNLWRTGNTYPNLGIRIRPNGNNNNFDAFYSSLNSNAGVRPGLVITYNPSNSDSIIKFRWPLSTSYASRNVKQSFGENWAGNKRCPANGPLKLHNGVDFEAGATIPIFAAEDGIVKESLAPSQTGGWASNIVIEHMGPTGVKNTTVYWHVTPDSKWVGLGWFIPKGTRMGSVADLSPYGNATHFHFGTRIGAYTPSLSGTGALPTTNCVDPSNGIMYPAFPAGFIDVNNTSNIIFG